MRHTFITTNSLALAAALLALGIPFFDGHPFVKTRSEKGENYTFFFQDVSNCGKFRTAEYMAAWNDPTFHETHPEDPFSYIKCAFTNREKLLDKVNQGLDLVMIERNGKIALISKTASKETQDAIFSKL